MIPREELIFTLAMAEKGLRSETPPEVMAELCRVYLAWVDAPEGRVDMPVAADAIVVDELPPSVWIRGKRVKLAEAPDE